MSVLFCFLLALALPAQAALVNEVSWLAGCWEFTRGNRTVTEQWTAARGGTMLGVSRTVSGGRTVEYEFIVIREANDRLEYVAKPSSQPEAVFTSVRISGEEAIFTNPQHDFPTRIHYRRQAGGGLLATVEGVVNGTRRAIEFPYTPVPCGR